MLIGIFGSMGSGKSTAAAFLKKKHEFESMPYVDLGHTKFLGVEGRLVCSDARFRNEFAAIKAAGGKMVRIKRPDAGLEGAAGQHISETEQLEIPDDDFDYVIDNNQDLPWLYTQLDRMISVFTGRLIPYDEAQKDIPPFKREPRGE